MSGLDVEHDRPSGQDTVVSDWHGQNELLRRIGTGEIAVEGKSYARFGPTLGQTIRGTCIGHHQPLTRGYRREF
jgi:hypothetical protein